VPKGANLVSPADGTVVYIKHVEPNAPVISCKQGICASINDIVREELATPKILIGIFMSPFDVHYNRAPLAGVIEDISHYPALGKNLFMSSMHLRTLLKKHPMYAYSGHIVQNNRAVTRIHGSFWEHSLSCYVIQIGGGSVHGIEVFLRPGERVEKGQVYGMIRIGSQVDVVVPQLPAMRVRVREGEKVRAGETILID
jgi:phosphatidylserine decarboxylase